MIFASLIGFLYSIAGSTGSSKLTDSVLFAYSRYGFVACFFLFLKDGRIDAHLTSSKTNFHTPFSSELFPLWKICIVRQNMEILHYSFCI